MKKDVHLVRDAIKKTREYQLFYMLIPVSWGLWNIFGSILSLTVSRESIDVVWAIVIGGGFLSQLGLYRFYSTRNGFMLKSVKDVGKVWMVIMLGIIMLNYTLPLLMIELRGFSLFAISAILIGIGLAITGVLTKDPADMIAGILWILSSNLYAYFNQHILLIHIAVVFVSIIVVPITSYIIRKDRTGDR
ncbi:MAG: hypothetical protein PF637_07330 [Spirochaetes bacterium]|nr:hypothetical protein [Spirochaetota bacterium]